MTDKTQPEALAQECADYATSLRSTALVVKVAHGTAPQSFLRAADLCERAAARISELERWRDAVRNGSALLNRVERAEAQVAKLEAQAAAKCLHQISEPLSEQDAGLLEQAASFLDALANDERNRGNSSTAEAAGCSAHAVRRLAVQLLQAAPPAQAQDAPEIQAPVVPAYTAVMGLAARDYLVHVLGSDPDLPIIWADLYSAMTAAAYQAAPPAPAAVPVLYVSPAQLAQHRDLEGTENAEAGRYLPSRKTPAGKFTQPLYAHAPAPVPVPSGMWTIWESLPGYLIDHCEGETITEERLQRALEAMLKDPQYSMPPAAPAQEHATQPTGQGLEDAPVVRAGLLAAAAHIRAKASAHAEECGSYDPDTGAFEMRDAVQEHYNTLDELAEEIRLLADKAVPESCDKPPAGWACSRTPGHDGPCAAVAATLAKAQEDARDALPCWWPDFIQNVAELPDRNSPEDEPEAMIATADELGACAIAARAAQEGAKP